MTHAPGGPLKHWSTIAPLVAAALLGAAADPSVDRRPGRGVRAGAGGRGPGGRAPRRGGGPQGGRAAGDPGPRPGGDGDRDLAHRLDDARRWRGQGGAGARHRLRRGDDHLQRGDRSLHPGRWAPAPGAVLPDRGGRPGVRRAGGALHPGARASGLHHQRPRPRLHPGAARLRRTRLAGALGGLRLRPDHPPPRLLPSHRSRGRGGAPATPQRGHDLAQRGSAAGLAGRGGGPGQGALSAHRGGGPRRRSAGRGHRHRHRHAGAGPRDGGRGPRRAGQPAPDQHEPGAGLGPGDHRPHHPRGGHRLASCSTSRSPSAWSRRTWCSSA